jgi:hypothetical protein
VTRSLTGGELVSLGFGLAVIAGALIAIARFRPAATVTLALALITVALLAAWVADPGRADSLVPLIGVGVGALASALTSLFSDDEP